MKTYHATVRLNVVADMTSRHLERELAEWLDTNLPPLLRPSNGVRVTAYEDVLIQEQAA
jgi:hypothetical protein